VAGLFVPRLGIQEGHACPPQDDMVKGTGRVDSGFTGHDGCVSLYPMKINLSPSPPKFPEIL